MGLPAQAGTLGHPNCGLQLAGLVTTGIPQFLSGRHTLRVWDQAKVQLQGTWTPQTWPGAFEPLWACSGRIITGLPGAEISAGRVADYADGCDFKSFSRAASRLGTRQFDGDYYISDFRRAQRDQEARHSVRLRDGLETRSAGTPDTWERSTGSAAVGEGAQGSTAKSAITPVTLRTPIWAGKGCCRPGWSRAMGIIMP